MLRCKGSEFDLFGVTAPKRRAVNHGRRPVPARWRCSTVFNCMAFVVRVVDASWNCRLERILFPLPLVFLLITSFFKFPLFVQVVCACVSVDR